MFIKACVLFHLYKMPIDLTPCKQDCRLNISSYTSYFNKLWASDGKQLKNNCLVTTHNNKMNNKYYINNKQDALKCC